MCGFKTRSISAPKIMVLLKKCKKIRLSASVVAQADKPVPERLMQQDNSSSR